MARSKAGRSKKTRIKLPNMIQSDQQNKMSRCVSAIMRPLRIFQLFAVLLVFAFTIYIMVLNPVPISIIACILLLVLSGVYIFILAVELIINFTGGALHVIPMVIFSFLGLLFFGVAGILFIFTVFTQNVVLIVAMSLCLLAALLFLIDITMVLAFWKRRCSVCKQCCNNSAAKLIVTHKDEKPNTSAENEIMRHDVTTSLSDVRIPRELEDKDLENAMPDHCYRKIGYPRRREYVDCPTCVPSLCNVEIAEIQTETKQVSVVESQTPIVITKETPMQTLSKCEFCHQQIQLPPVEGAVPSTHCFQHTSQWSYPAIVQFVRGGVNAPCCPGCKCETDTKAQTPPPQQQQQQQSQELTQQRRSLTRTKVKSNPSKTLTSETTQQVANSENGTDDNVAKLTTVKPITTYTVASFYDPDKRTQTVPDIGYKQEIDGTKIKEDAKATSEDAEETIIKIVKTKEPEIIEETMSERVNVKGRNEKSPEGSEEEKTNNTDEKIERSKGGGEHCSRIYREFMRATEPGSTINLEESSMHTGGTLITSLSNRTKPRTLLHLKSNKVDPIKDANVFDEDRTLEKVTPRTVFDNQAAQESEHSERPGSPDPTTEYQSNDCSFCRRQKILTPTSDNSRCYIVFKDKKGKYFCEFCAPQDSKKITNRLESKDAKKLRCSNCRLHIRDRGVRTNLKLKSDTCPKCNRSLGHAASPSST